MDIFPTKFTNDPNNTKIALVLNNAVILTLMKYKAGGKTKSLWFSQTSRKNHVPHIFQWLNWTFIRVPLVFYGCLKKVPQTEQLRQHKFTDLSLEVQDQGTSKTMLIPKAPRKDWFLASLLTSVVSWLVAA